MSFKSKIRHFSEIERALLFALKVYSKNSPIEGMIINNDCEPPVICDLLEISSRMTEKLLKNALNKKVLGKVGERYLIVDYWKNREFTQVNNKSLKRISKSPKIIGAILELLGFPVGVKKKIVDKICYNVKESLSVKEIFDKNCKQELIDVVREYAFSFSTKTQKNKKRYSKSKMLKNSLAELFDTMIAKEYFSYNGKDYQTNISLIEEALEIVISKDLIELQNNNYVKKILIQKGRKQEQNDY